MIPLPVLPSLIVLSLLQSSGIPAVLSSQNIYARGGVGRHIMVPRDCYKDSLAIIARAQDLRKPWEPIPADYVPKSKPVVGVGELFWCAALVIFVLNLLGRMEWGFDNPIIPYPFR